MLAAPALMTVISRPGIAVGKIELSPMVATVVKRAHMVVIGVANGCKPPACAVRPSCVD
jgi:hypothetical protein